MKSNIRLLNETLKIIDTGSYSLPADESTAGNPVTVSLKLSKEQMCEAIVLTDSRVKELVENPPYKGPFVMGGRCSFSVTDNDSLAAAAEISKSFLFKTDNYKLLVLNFANPVEPGGGVRRGARAQEEDLCRKSTLLASLESNTARAMYKYNMEQSYILSSDYMILSPNVEVFRDHNNDLLEESFVVSVLTAAAPYVTEGTDGIPPEVVEEAFYQRIMGVLQVATTYEYKYLVLGAWGCGAFGNDAKKVAQLFYKAFKEIKCAKHLNVSSLFRCVEFAILSRSQPNYNYDCFHKYFSHFYRDEDEEQRQSALERMKKNEVWLDSIRGCLIGGAAGDALGYPVEFISLDEIYKRYSDTGITGYTLDKKSGKAIITDDTQMTLFTATGILYGATRAALRGISGPLESYIYASYLDWYETQTGEPSGRCVSWLYNVEELNARRAPGNTCLNALRNGFMGEIDMPVNDSKGCGGVMRVAPIALYFKKWYSERTGLTPFMEGAKAAAITHGHPLGYITAAALVHIIYRIVYGGCPTGDSLYDIVDECCSMIDVFRDKGYTQELIDLIELAKNLSRNEDDDTVNIKKLGEGWVAEEALAISIYCSLKYYDDFSAAIIAAVNHSGDSDSTGSITGNIVGAHIGYENIPQKWKTDLELHDIILEVADDLCHECQMSEYSTYTDGKWSAKYGMPNSYMINRSLRGFD